MFDYEGFEAIDRAWREGLTPDPQLSVSEWADRYRMLSSKSASEPGRWSTRRTPYLKAIMDCLSPASPVERVVFMKGAQVGGTECGNNWIGYCIHLAPGPMMAVSPTVEMAKRNSKQRIDPLIEESSALSERISPSRSRDAGNTVLAKEFRGGVLVMTGANSAVGLRSMPVRYLFLDEVDGYPADVDGEGDAIQLAEARTRTFARRKILIVSTPTVAGVSPIEREYESSDQRRYFLPCPHCGHRQWLRFEQLRWKWGEPETARYVCESCEDEIQEQHKSWMLEQGEWRATAPESAGKTVGFHLSSLYSPLGWRSWADIARAWEQAQGSATRLKAFKNTELGETWVEEGEAPDWERLLERREAYRIGSVPTGGLLLAGGADVQKDRIEASVWAFGRGKEAWLIEHRVLMGDIARDGVWKRLAGLLNETWTHESGSCLPLVRFALDTGFATQESYAFVRRMKDSRLMAVKGVARGAALVGTPTAVDITYNGKRLRRGIKVFAVAGAIAKLEFYNNLRKTVEVSEDGEIQYPAGYVHLPKMDAEFIKQLCAEQLITRRNRNGFPVREWQKLRERNEALACRSMLEGGECFIRLRPRWPEDGMSVPLQLQLLESEHVPTTINTLADNGNTLRAGIEFDRLGRRVAYHMTRAHPNDAATQPGADRLTTVRVPAEQVIHLFRPLRPGQLRGEPWLARALVKLEELDQYDDAELVRKKTAAMFAGFITCQSPEDNLMGEGDGTGVALAGLEPGTLQILEPGEDVKFSAPADLGSAYRDFMRQQFRAVAAAMGITYEMLTGDLTQVNYSSIRAGLLEFRRRREAIQHGVIVHQFCRPVWNAWMDQAVLSGNLELPGFAADRRRWRAVKWIPQGWQWVDPQKEFDAMQTAIRSGLMSRSEAISAFGYDAEDVDREIAADNARADALGLVFDSDPRHGGGGKEGTQGPVSA